MAGTSISPPSTLVLDYMYGITAYHCWGSGQETKEVMHKHFTDHYKSIPMPPASLPSSDRDSSPETDDLNDNTDRHPQGRKHSLKMSHEMLKAMDDVLMISMLIKGRTPEMIASERQKQQEVEELHAEEAGRVKVQQWMQSLPCVPLTSGSH